MVELRRRTLVGVIVGAAILGAVGGAAVVQLLSKPATAHEIASEVETTQSSELDEIKTAAEDAKAAADGAQTAVEDVKGATDDAKTAAEDAKSESEGAKSAAEDA